MMSKFDIRRSTNEEVAESIISGKGIEKKLKISLSNAPEVRELAVK